MKKHFVFILMIAAMQTAAAQFRNDNVLYKTVYLQELCKTLQENPGYTILDVRSKGEYEDTSSSSTLNLGHIKGAMNININELPVRWKEISGMKDKPVFVYCTHSQRSRRASKLLADSGLQKFSTSTQD
ncbi:MAG: rhodanese-like domain-containing protein [Bacteroidia bacterium]|nr:rhodanese-like domain-containing protein [Bacteroidia bacterium]